MLQQLGQSRQPMWPHTSATQVIIVFFLQFVQFLWI